MAVVAVPQLQDTFVHAGHRPEEILGHPPPEVHRHPERQPEQSGQSGDQDPFEVGAARQSLV